MTIKKGGITQTEENTDIDYILYNFMTVIKMWYI